MKMKASRASEKYVGEVLSMKHVPGSGCAFYDGDLIDDEFLIEDKTVLSPRKQYSISRDVLDKARRQAFSMGRPYYALTFDFGTYDKRNRKEKYVVMELNTFRALREGI